ncbi:hypothetical protein AGMMS50276_30040 [Synergistales bacterium]|nr:hypothetical protein AGMMS50276_30040 [Synergistales bacterium]
MNLEKIKNIFGLNPNSMIALFIRHGEKSECFGSLLTQDGIFQSENFGYELKRLNIPVKIYTSPEMRCVQTAVIINKTISSMEDDIIISNKLGVPGIQIFDIDAYQELCSKVNFHYREIYAQWKKGKHYDALRPPIMLKDTAEEFIKSTCINRGITLYVSQSGTIAGIGYVLRLVDYDIIAGEWVNFLDGFVLDIATL